MTNAFTQKPDTSWIKQLTKSHRAAKESQRRASNPTPAQRMHFHRDYNPSAATIHDKTPNQD